MMSETNKKPETMRILIFLGITFLMTIGYCVAVIYPALSVHNVDNVRQQAGQLGTLLIAAVMFFPAIGVLLTRLITKEGFKNAWLHPHMRGNIKIYLLAYFGPGILTIFGAIVYFLIFPSHFDAQLGYMRATFEAAGGNVDALPISLSVVLIAQVAEAFLLGPILNFITCFGEEWGWRGYLLPKMAAKIPMIPMLFINGVIWGLWHAPLTAIGHNYGVGYPGFPYVGIAAMCGFCIVIGVFLSYVAMKTKSCIPAVLAHGALNSIAAVGGFFTADGGNPFVGPAPTGIVGGIPFIIVAVPLMVFYFAKEDNRREEA